MKRSLMSLLSIIILILAGLSCVVFIDPEEGFVYAQKEKAPDFTVIDIYNNSFTLSKHRGEVVVLNFFTISSSSSKIVIEEMKEVYEQMGSEIIMISIDILPDDTEEDIEEYCNMNGYRWKFAKDTDELILKYSVTNVPKICIIDTDGDISYSQDGIVGSVTITEEVEKAYVTHEDDYILLVIIIFLISAIIGIILVIAVIKTGQSSKISGSMGHTNGVYQEYPCSTCGQPMIFITEQQQWYCNYCRKYV